MSVVKIDLPDPKKMSFAQAETTGLRRANLVLSAGDDVFEIKGHTDCFRELATVIMRDVFGVDTSELSKEEWDKAWIQGNLWRRWLAGDPDAFRRNRDPEDPK